MDGEKDRDYDTQVPLHRVSAGFLTVVSKNSSLNTTSSPHVRACEPSWLRAAMGQCLVTVIRDSVCISIRQSNAGSLMSQGECQQTAEQVPFSSMGLICKGKGGYLLS